MTERRYAIILGLVLAVLCSTPSRAQQEASGQKEQEPVSQVPGSAPSEPATSQPTDSSVIFWPQSGVRPAGSTPVLAYNSFLRWGPLSVRTLEVLQGYDQIEPSSGTAAQGIFNQRSFTSTIFRSEIDYDKQLKQSRLEFQYSPRLSIVNGQVSQNFVNQNANINWTQQLSPRWTLAVGESVTYAAVRQLYGDYFLDVNAVTGTTLPSSFLDGGGGWLSTSSQFAVGYMLSSTSSISVAPFFGYSHVTGQINAAVAYDIYQYGGKIGWSKQLSPFRSISLGYYARVVGNLGDGVLYQSGEIGYVQRLGASTILGLSGGLLTGGFAQQRQSDFSGSVQVSRQFGRSTGGVGYYRGVPLIGETASQGVAQRADASYRLDLSQRWYSQVRGGYEDSLWSTGTDVSGKFISGEFGYNLNAQWSCFVSYAHKIQSGNDPHLLAGTRNFYLAGIRWSARAVQPPPTGR